MLTLVIIGSAVVAVLGWNLIKRFSSDRIQHFVDGRRESSRLVTRAEFIDGSRHLPVSLALSGSSLYYENSVMQSSLDLEWVEEVEYESDLVKGQYAGEGRILRLRCSRQAFEFLIPIGELQQWQTILPAHRRVTSAGAPHADASLVARAS